MKTRLIFTLLISGICANAQLVPKAQAGFAFGGTGINAMRTVVQTADKSYYVGGEMYDGTINGVSVSSSSPNGNAIISKFDKNDNLQWTLIESGVESFESVHKLVLDANNDLIAVGNYYSTMTFGTQTINHPNGNLYGGFVAKVDTSGNCIWLTHVNAGSLFDVDVDASGNVVAIGEDFNNIIIHKLTSSGTPIFSKTIGGSGSFDTGYGIAVDGSSNIYVTGRFSNSFSFEGVNVSNGGSQYDLFFAKFNSTGTLQWVKEGNSVGNNKGLSIEINVANDIILVGSYTGPFTFAGQTITSVMDLGNSQTMDMFVAKFNTTGTMQWIKHAGTDSEDIANDVAIDSNGDIYVVGEKNVAPMQFPGFTLDQFGATGQGYKRVFIASYNTTGGFRNALSGGDCYDNWGFGISILDSSLIIAAENRPCTTSSTYQNPYGADVVIPAEDDWNSTFEGLVIKYKLDTTSSGGGTTGVLTLSNQPADITIDCDVTNAPSNTGQTTATTTCSSGGLSITYSDAAVNTCTNEMVITRTWNLIDNCGNSQNFDQIITVQDTVKPTINCSGSQQMAVDGSALIDYTTTLTVSDNCSGTNDITLSQTPAPGSVTISNSPTIVSVLATDECGNSEVCSFIVSSQDTSSTNTGISKIDNQKIKIYPNPFSDKTTIEFDNQLTVESVSLINIQGVNMNNWKVVSNKIIIEKGNLSKGMYLLKIKTKNNVYFLNQKLIIK